MKNLPANAEAAGDVSSITGSGRYLGEQNGNPLWYSSLENPMDIGAWRATVHRVPESDMTEHLNSSSTTPPPTSATYKRMRTDLRPLEPLCLQA